MRYGILAILMLLTAVGPALGYTWKEVDQTKRLGGRKISAGYLRGRVVLVDARDYADPSQSEPLHRLQALWTAFKRKPFVLVGLYSGSADLSVVSNHLARAGITYPVYSELEAEGLKTVCAEGYVRVFDSTFTRQLYYGANDVTAKGVVASAIMSTLMPTSVSHWEALIDWELKNTPARAYLRIQEFNKMFPQEASAYQEKFAALKEREDVKKTAKLVNFALKTLNRASDAEKRRPFTQARYNKVKRQFEDLKTQADPLLAQEAKNALADLAYLAALTSGK